MIAQKVAALLPLLAIASAAPAALFPRADDGQEVKVGNVLPAELKAEVQAIFDYFAIPGAVVAVVSPDEAVNGVEVFGIKDAEGNNMTADIFHSIGSNSKFVTALSLATMEAWGNITTPKGDKFTLDAKWKDIYPDFMMVDPNATEQATLANFMIMNTGIPTVNWAIGANDTPVETLAKFSELVPNAPFPTNASQYSTIHYNALAGVPKFVANQSLEEFLNAYIWGPAGMEAKVNALDAGATGRRGQAFAVHWDNTTACALDLVSGIQYNESTACAPTSTIFDYWSDGTTLEQEGGGSVLMTGEDMYKWSQLAIGKTKIVPEPALDALYSNRYDIPIVGISGNLSYGLGVNKFKGPDRVENVKYSHGGAVYGHNSAFVRAPQTGTAAFVVVNEDRFGYLLADVVAEHIYNSLTNQTLPGDVQRYIDLIVTQSTGVPVGQSAEEAQGGEGSSSGQQDGGAASAAGATSLPPANPRPVPEGINIEGNYTGPGYPSISISAVNLTDASAIDEAGLSADLVEEAAAVGIDVTRPTYLGSWEGSFTKHILLTHFDGPAFNYTLILPRPKLGEYANGSISQWDAQPGDTNAVKIYGLGPAVFGPGKEGQQGLGFFGSWFGQPDTVITSPVYNEEEVESTSALFCAKQ